MKKLWAALLLCAALNGGGCDLFTSKDYLLTDAQVTQVAMKLGPLTDANRAEYILETSKLLSDTVTAVKTTTEGLAVTLIPAIAQAQRENTGTPVIGLPEPYGSLATLILGVIGTATGAVAVKKRRESVTKRAAAKGEAKVV